MGSYWMGTGTAIPRTVFCGSDASGASPPPSPFIIILSHSLFARTLIFTGSQEFHSGSIIVVVHRVGAFTLAF